LSYYITLLLLLLLSLHDNARMNLCSAAYDFIPQHITLILFINARATRGIFNKTIANVIRGNAFKSLLPRRTGCIVGIAK